MKANKSSKKQVRRKSSKKQPGRKSPRKSVPTRDTLKKFAPLSVKIPSSSKQSLDKVAWEENLEVERTFKEGPDDIYDSYYKLNPNRHHVWTNHLVIRRDTFQKLLKNLKRDDDCIKMKDLKKFNQCCLDDPENYFYLKELGEKMGHGLFARRAIPANSIIGEYTGELISRKEWSKRRREYKEATNYDFATCTNFTIDAGAMGNHTRFINHSCENNCRTEYAFISGIPRNFIVSNRAIKADEQLFIWYGEEYFQNSKCACKSKKCVSNPSLKTEEK